MNSLSLLIYLAELADSISKVMVLGVGFLSVCVVTIFVFGPLVLDEKMAPPMVRKAAARTLAVWWLIPAMSVIVALIPSQTTIYMIAASEAGEAVVTSPEGQELLQDVQKAIRLQLKKLGGE